MPYNPDHVFEIIDNLTGMLIELLNHNQPGYIDRLNYLWKMWSFQTINDDEMRQAGRLLTELRQQMNKEGQLAGDWSPRQSSPDSAGQETPADLSGQPHETGFSFPADSPSDFRGDD